MTKEATWRCAHGWLRGEQCELCKETMTKDKALKLALDELIRASSYCNTYDAITAIKEALAQPVTSELLGNPKQLAQPEQRPWVGLTRREVEWCFDDANGSDVVAAKNIEAKLKEKNT